MQQIFVAVSSSANSAGAGEAHFDDGRHEGNPVVPAQAEVDRHEDLRDGDLHFAARAQGDEEADGVHGDGGEQADVAKGALPGHQGAASHCNNM